MQSIYSLIIYTCTSSGGGAKFGCMSFWGSNAVTYSRARCATEFKHFGVATVTEGDCGPCPDF